MKFQLIFFFYFCCAGLPRFESCQGGCKLSWNSSPWISLHCSGIFLPFRSMHLVHASFLLKDLRNCFSVLYQEGLDALEEVIYHIETYDVTTIRASTPMFLMSRKIKSLGVKMVLSGEGSDEIFGGYLYFHKAPNKEELHQETCRKVCRLCFSFSWIGARANYIVHDDIVEFCSTATMNFFQFWCLP